ncbi:competence protein ComEA helix-hairpin-helix repeat protein [Shewanella sediminis HAW-EB3]|uniref:Competence protein ComEA helix-hairpin-helix repeat protein n=1 Tax=Shewanella sediminis (strain HAW-EB3) TaxID=425104 RepID=A8FTJ9_SHESH|nr:ComEA family DNA-binding protein [Shewanella sediminis]ABV36172.1 competence protein ComEA helix-hairpin-helix repeat protein [Shewanella sediminis HAW-EB3]
MKHTVITALFTAALLSLNINIAEAKTKSPEVDVVQPQSQHQSINININTASVQELVLLNGIGESKAQAIIDYRTSHGQFDSINDLVKVKGIGTKLVEKNKGVITL